MAINAVFYENTVPQGTGVLAIRGDEGETDLFVPLRSTSVTGTFHGPVGSIVLTQTFRFARRAMDRPIEAVYRFPLPGDAAVTGVVATFGDETVGTRLAERKAAEREYDGAFKSGKKAALVTRESPDVFTLHLTGIPPDTDVVVETTVTLLARAVPKGWELRLPVTIGPRYVRRDEDHPGVQANPLLSAVDPGYRASLDLRLLPAAEVTASPAGASVERTADGTLVRLDDAMPDRDFVVRWAAATDGWLTAWAADDEKGEFTYLLGLVTPQGGAPGARIPREAILVADQSGSMSGLKWEAAAASIRSFLDGLGPDELFNLCLFSNRAAWFSAGGPVPATPEAIGAAKRFLEETSLFGGTELGVALEQALRQPLRSGAHSRHVLVITDGEVTDEARLLRLVETRAAGPSPRRVSVIAIDSAPNSHLALELARLGGGVAKFLAGFGDNVEEIGVTLGELLAAWQPPVLADALLTADRPGLEAVDYRVADGPGNGGVDIGDLRPETPVFVVARVPFSATAPALAVAAGKGTVATASALPGDAALATALKVVFGASRIRALEYLESAGHGEAEVRRRLGELGYALPEEEGVLYPENRGEAFRSRLERLIVDESLRFGVPSTHTAFVGVSATRGEAPAVTVGVPNAVPAGWQLKQVRGAADDWSVCQGMRRSPAHPARTSRAPLPRGVASGGEMIDIIADAPMPPPQVPVAMIIDADALAEEARKSGGRPRPKTVCWEIRSFDAARGLVPLFRPYWIRKGRYVLVVVFPEDAAPVGISISVRLDGEEIAAWNGSASDGGGHQVVVPFEVKGAGLLEALAVDPRREWHRRPITVFVRRGWTGR
ncbi:MAG: VWA domain-containing protein [Methanospirillum sp.]|nr:VWA domain-containing protein [Methanospirillum sp.]